MKLKGKEFEALTLARAREMEKQKLLTMGSYGVSGRDDEQPADREFRDGRLFPLFPTLKGVIFGRTADSSSS
jgi:hypothetical protein